MRAVGVRAYIDGRPRCLIWERGRFEHAMGPCAPSLWSGRRVARRGVARPGVMKSIGES